MTSIFTKIINGEIPGKKIYENELVYAFLDIHPETVGHALIVPKIEVDKWQDVDDKHFLEVFKVAKKITPKILKSLDAERMILKVVGTDVPHFHLHLMPYKAQIKIKKDELEKVHDTILKALEN